MLNVHKMQLGIHLETKGKRVMLALVAFVLVVVAYLVFIRPALMPTRATAGVELFVFFLVFTAFIAMLVALIVVLMIAGMRTLLMRGQEKNKVWYQRLRHRLAISGVLTAGLLLYVLASQWLAYTPPISGKDGNPLAGSIATLETVELNGSSQWITIRGVDEKRPVLLFLAGGPGGSQLAAARSELSALEENFVVVGWDQPGAAKSFHAVPQSEQTRQRYIDDGCALAQYLCERFGQEKIYLLGESWGSALGIWMAEKQPELFYAFVGTGQMVSFLETEQVCFDLALKAAQEQGDLKTVQSLTKQGPPPYYGKGVAMKMATYLMYLFNVMSANPEIAASSHNTFMDLAGTEYGVYDKLTYMLGLTDTLGTVYQQLYDIDLRKQTPKLSVPVYFFEGRHDINAPTYLVEDYFALLEAPHKQIFWFEYSGHTPWVDERDLFVQMLVDVLLADR